MRWCGWAVAASSGGSGVNPRTGWWWRRCDGSAKMESWRAASGRSPLCGVVSGGALPVAQLGSSWMRGSDRRKAGLWSGRRRLRSVLPEVRGGCGLLFRLGVGAVAGFLLVVQPVVGPRLCDYFSFELRWRRCEAYWTVLPNSRRRGDVRCADENLAWLMSGRRRWHPWVSSPSWRRRRGVCAMPLALLELVAVSGRKPRFDVGSAHWRRP